MAVDHRENDLKIKKVLQEYGESLTGSVWRVQGTAVIYHKTLERIATKAKIWFSEPQIIQADKDCAVLRVTGYLQPTFSDGMVVGWKQMEWSIGEALVGVNYRVSGKQAAYVWAMAEKRAKDRVILKLIELSGLVFSEEEADDFKRAGTRGETIEDTTEHDADGVIQETPAPTDTSAVRGSTPAGQEAYSGAARVGQKAEDSVAAKVKANIDRRKTVNEILGFMAEDRTAEALQNRMTKQEAQEVMDYALAAAVALGYVIPEEDKPEGPSSRITDPDPYAKSNLSTLPNRISTAIKDAKTVAEMEKLLDAVLVEQKLEWNKLPEDVQKKVDAVADKKAKFIAAKQK